MNFCFVILHYKTAQDTIECVNSINKMSCKCHIVIVDNASNNGSIEIVENKLAGYDNVHIIKNKENLGFASGNNIGYKYAKEKLSADFIAVSNNDIIIESKNLAEYIMSLYNKNKFDILGPAIESLVDHKYQNPMAASNMSPAKVKKEILRYKILYMLSRLKIYDFLVRKNHRKTDYKIDLKKECMKENVQLHGSFMVFSSSYIKNEDNAFIPGTFLYMEESILFQYCKKKNYKTLYTPEIKVYHKEDSSTNSLFNTTKDKREFIFKNMIKSLKVYYNILNMDN